MLSCLLGIGARGNSGYLLALEVKSFKHTDVGILGAWRITSPPGCVSECSAAMGAGVCGFVCSSVRATLTVSAQLLLPATNPTVN